MAVSAQQLAFIQLQQHAFPGAKPQLLPVELFFIGIFVMKIQRSVITAVAAMKALAAQIKNRVFLALNPAIHLILAQTFFAVGMDSPRTLAIKIGEA